MAKAAHNKSFFMTCVLVADN